MCGFFMNKWLVTAGVLAVLLVATVAFAHGYGARGSDWRGSKGWKDVGGRRARKAPTAGVGGRVLLTSR